MGKKKENIIFFLFCQLQKSFGGLPEPRGLRQQLSQVFFKQLCLWLVLIIKEVSRFQVSNASLLKTSQMQRQIYLAYGPTRLGHKTHKQAQIGK